MTRAAPPFPIPEGRALAIVGGLRTPFARAGTTLKTMSAGELGAHAIRELLARGPVRAEDVDDVVMGCVGPEAGEANPARVMALRAGLPHAVPAATVNRNCASGMEALIEAARKTANGEADVVIAGGAESMSRYPLIFGREATAIFESASRAKSSFAKAASFARLRPRHLKPRIAILEGLVDPACGLNMGQTAELLAREYKVSRGAQDGFALESHRRATAAEKEGFFSGEIAPVFPGAKPGAPSPVERDEGIRREQTLEQLAKLRPYFQRDGGTVTVGNACPVTDGAVAIACAAVETARARRWPILGIVRASAVAGLDPSRMGLGPVYATAKLLARVGLRTDEIDLYEINEAFAAQVLACLAAAGDAEFSRRELGLDRALGAPPPEKINIHGGAIALGHPVGASGARIVLTLLRSLEHKKLRRGVATLCVGGGQGAAVLVERPEP